MDQLDIAMHQTAHEATGGLNALARRLGIREQVLRNKVCPTTETFHLNLREAVAMMDATGDYRILEVVSEMCGFVLSHKPMPSSSSIVSAVLTSDAEHGDVSRTIRDAIADGKLTDAEKSQITKQIHEAQTSLDALRSTVMQSPTMLRA